MGRLTHRTSPGWTYFVTTKSAQNISVFQVKENAEILIAKLFEYRDKGHYLLHDLVVMPNHLHLLITPEQTASLEKAMQLIKGGSSHAIHQARGTKNEIWQSGFHESRVTDSAGYKIKADYIRFNPFTAKLVEKPEDWPYSSANESFVLDPIPQGLKPPEAQLQNVGAKAPTPKAFVGVISGAKASDLGALTQGLKPLPPKESPTARMPQALGRSRA